MRTTSASILLVAVLALLSPSSLAAGQGTAPAAASPGVLLELFTSQGCSSCPPADRLLRRLAEDPALAGKVFPLAFHVDYWNHLGWQDPFSSPRWSERQSRYAAALEESQVYTPQLVVDGRTHLVGSREQQVRQEIERALARPAAAVLAVTARRRDGRLEVEVEARRTGGGETAELVALVAVYEDNLSTPVPSGENSGRRLANDRVVRYLEPVATLAAGDSSVTGTLTLPVEDGWEPEQLGVVAFLQDPRSMAVVGAAAAPAH